MRLVTKTSPNQSHRLHGNDAVRLIVCHTPEGSYTSALATCMNPAAEVSYHRLYKKDGTEATQLVPFERKAWHAGPVNSLSDGLSLEGHARHFELADPGSFDLAEGVAERLIARGLPCQWTTDPAKGGFCRHGDLQDNRSDPTPDMNEWRLFVAMVKEAHGRLTVPDWPKPLPAWFWVWARWRLGEGEYKKFGPRKGPRPKAAPRLIPPGHWAWRRLRALLRERKQ